MDETRRYLRDTLVSWTVLCAVFNVALISEGVWLGHHRFDWMLRHWGFVLLFGITANTLLCLAPTLECYGCVLFGRRLGRMRYVLRFALFILVLLYFTQAVKWGLRF